MILIFCYDHWHCIFAWKLESKYNSEILPVFVTIDPQRDNPSQLRAYLNGESSHKTKVRSNMPALRYK